ncbi:LPS-assembly protein LptD [Halovulum dunhuangense]|uniref:LPS-assembly protein LptD n=1 Tax=Halovulum dunhuangense TaxID=1505036 RepID=A0A849L3R2_9RHOB|nr:LPS assembly protein LptD [Halovulum dunhuangense]NNU80807.1 LPS-assembly protein LptD [Halovulum dunhuangense]
MRGLLLALALVLVAPLAASAQDAVALFADRIRYETQDRELVAEGNVEVYYDGYRLTARTIRYSGDGERIRAEGPLRLEGPDGAVLIASLAELSGDFREGLIEGARLIFDRQFQIAAAEGRRSEGRFNSLTRTVATSCTICARAETPIWRIRAASVVHDEQARRLYFESAWLDIFGLPLLYLPSMSIPEPGVERARGFLVPNLRTSGLYGIGVQVPYFIPLGDHADITITPFLATNGTAILEGEYRRRFRSGLLELNGAISLADGTSDHRARGFLEARGGFDIGRGYETEFDLRYASDQSFLGQYDYSDDDRLTSFLTVRRSGNTSYFEARTEAYQTLREAEAQDEIPLVLPWLTWRQIRRDTLGGTLGLEATMLGLVREDGRDILRGGLDADWRARRILRSGIELGAVAEISGDAYVVQDDAAFDDAALFRATPTVGVELRWPFARTTAAATHVIEPIAQLLYSDTLGDAVPNEDSLLPEFDENNLFALNRFPGRDARETGLRLNAGVSYTRFDPAGWNMGLTLGRVFRDGDATEFPASTGLRDRRSDYVAAVSLDLPPRFTGLARGLFDEELSFRRADLELDYRTRRFDADAVYTFLAADATNPVLGPQPERQELALGTRYLFHPNWELEAEWRYDIEARESIEALGALTYGNECIEARLEVSRNFTSANDVPRDTSIAFEVVLAGFGGASRDWPARRCQGN